MVDDRWMDGRTVGQTDGRRLDGYTISSPNGSGDIAKKAKVIAYM